MGYENFNETTSNNPGNSDQLQLNLCNLMAVGDTLKNDFATHGPGMLQTGVSEAVKHPERVVAGCAAGALIAAGILAESPVIIGLASAAGLTVAGGVLLDTVLPKVQIEDKGKKN